MGRGRGVTATGEDTLQAGGGLMAVFWLVAHRRLLWDEFYERLFLRPYQALARFLATVIDWDFLHNYLHDAVLHAGFKAAGRFLARPVDLGVVDGAVNGVARLIQSVSANLRRDAERLRARLCARPLPGHAARRDLDVVAPRGFGRLGRMLWR